MVDLSTQFQNNRRREAAAVTAAIPFSLSEGDLREGTAGETLVTGDYVVAKLPAGVLVTEAFLVVEPENVFDGAAGVTKVGITIDGSSMIASTDVTIVQTKKGAGTAKVTTAETDVVASVVIDAATTTGKASIVLRYIDYSRGTMSYLG